MGAYASKAPPGRGSYTIEVTHPEEGRRRELTATWEPVARVWLVGRCSIEALGYSVVGWRSLGSLAVPEPDGFWDVPLVEVVRG